MRRQCVPSSRRSVTVACPRNPAIHETASSAGLDDQEVGFGDLLRTARARAAKMRGADTSEVALIGPTTTGLSAVASGLDWKVGDEVLVYQDDFPANVYPWLSLEKRGVTVSRLKTSALGQITPELVLEHLTDPTRLVALASCHFVSGWRIDHDAIGRVLRARDILFCLDATCCPRHTRSKSWLTRQASISSVKITRGPGAPAGAGWGPRPTRCGAGRAT